MKINKNIFSKKIKKIGLFKLPKNKNKNLKNLTRDRENSRGANASIGTYVRDISLASVFNFSFTTTGVPSLHVQGSLLLMTNHKMGTKSLYSMQALLTELACACYK